MKKSLRILGILMIILVGMEKHNQKKPADFSGYFHDLAYYLAYYLELIGVVIVKHGYRIPPVQIA